MEFSAEHLQFAKVVREFAEAELAPHVFEWDKTKKLPVEAVQKMGQLGLFGLTADEEYGGAGADFTTLCLAIENIGRVDQSLGITLSAAVGLGINPIATFGTKEQKEQWLPDLIAGRALAGFGLTEAEAGSDAGATRTKAELDGDEWVVNGSKQFITNSGTPITSVVTVTARTGTRENGKAEISAIIIPSGTKGFTVEPSYEKLGWPISDTHPLTFEDARVPSENLLGERGRGYAQFLATLDDGRVAIAALALGLIEACLEHSIKYAQERHTFGVPIGSRQAIAFSISDLAVLAETTRALVYRAAALKDNNAPEAEFKKAAAIAKLQSSEAAVTATRIATQIFGGNGFMLEYPVARMYRDAKILEIGEGTSEVQRLLIARSLGLPVD